MKPLQQEMKMWDYWFKFSDKGKLCQINGIWLSELYEEREGPTHTHAHTHINAQ